MTEAIRAIPPIILAMALTAVFGGGIRNIAIILGISNVAAYIRMMRGRVYSVKESDYIMASKLQGVSNLGIMFKHLLPNSISPIIVLMTQQLAELFCQKPDLAFWDWVSALPLPPGELWSVKRRNYLLDNPVISLAPGICVALLVICLNMFGDGIRDALDPRLRGEL